MSTTEALNRPTDRQAEHPAAIAERFAASGAARIKRARAELASSYHFVTHWRVQGGREEVAAILDDVSALPQWWPSVYLDVRVLAEGDHNGVGRVADLWTKGWLPYTLRWRFTTASKRGAEGLSLQADGDFRGFGTWILTQDGDWVDAEYDWRIIAEKPLLRRLSWLLRPVFEANHLWAMRRGEESLRLELERRRAPDAAARQRVPAPPPPTFARLTRRTARRW